MGRKYRGVLAKYHVVSLRVTDSEERFLRDLADGRPVSDVMRTLVFDYVASVSPRENFS